MKKSKRAHLEAHGWRVGSATDFLELSPEEAAFVETKLALSQTLRTRRTAQHLSQSALAKRLNSSQSRVAKMEAADPTVSVDLLLRALFALGAKPRDVAIALQKRRSVAAISTLAFQPRRPMIASAAAGCKRLLNPGFLSRLRATRILNSLDGRANDSSPQQAA